MKSDPIFETAPIERVREGMVVLDENSRRLGTVERIRMGDPGAVTTAGEQPIGEQPSLVIAPEATGGGTTPVGTNVPFFGQADETPDVPDPLRTTLLRVGFIVVDGPDLEGAQRYIPADRIVDVRDNAVRLRADTTAATTYVTPPTAASPMPAYPSGAIGESRPMNWRWAAAAAGGICAVGAASRWAFRRHAERNRPQARLRRSVESLTDQLPDDAGARLGGIGGVIGLALLVRTLWPRRDATSARPADATDSGRAAGFHERPRLPLPLLAALAIGFGLWRRSRGQHTVSYIGTPGVESAAGRDRTQSGELPREYGVERVYR